MIKIDEGHFSVVGDCEDIIYDLMILLIAINDRPKLQELLKVAEAEVKTLVKEGRYVPNNSSDKS